MSKANLNAEIQAAERDPVSAEDIMEKQPNSRICFVCGIDNPIGLHLAFYTDDQGRCIARFRPQPQHQGYPGQLSGVSSIDLIGPCAGYTRVAPRSRRSLQVARATELSKAYASGGRSPVKTEPSSRRSETQ